MQTENKIIAQKFYDEALRLMNNAKKELLLANKNGMIYRNVKHLRIACGITYLAVLKAVDGIFLLKNIPKPKRRASIEYYMQGFSQIDKKMLHALNVVYEQIHRCGYYDGFNDVKILTIAFEKAEFIIYKLKESI